MNTTKTGLGILIVLTLISTILLNIPYVENNIMATIYVPTPDLGFGNTPIILKYCEDSDGGIATNTRGTTTTQIDAKTDYCLGSNRVTEYYCDGIERKSVDRLCADGFECIGGACEKKEYYFCYETDEGIDYYTTGKVSSNDENYEDYCLSKTKIREYYCGTGSLIYSIDKIAPENYMCNNGAFEFECRGPIFKEINIYEKTEIKGILSLNYGYYSDYCKTDTSVIKYYCDTNNRVNSDIKNCPKGYFCQYGACISKTCEGSEEIDLYKKNTVKFDKTSKTDYCLSERKVNKYYCSNNEIVEETKNCPDGYICYNGACLLEKNVECEDDDYSKSNKGKDIYTAGIVTKGEFREYEDKCLTSTKVREYYCDSNNIATYDDINCPSGYYCTGDRCVQSGVKEYCYNYGEGYVLTHNGKYNNYCIDRGLVREYYCSNNVMNYRDVYCPNNYVCSLGQCIDTESGQTTETETNEEETKPPSLDDIDEIETFKIYIKKGWNLFPVIPYEENTYEIIENDCVDFNNDIIWGYSKQMKDYESTNNLEVNKAYWFYSTKNCEFEYQVLSGSTTNKISLTDGWNMFSVTKTTLVSELKDCEIVRGPYKFDTASKRYIRVKQLIKGEGYIMRLNNSCTIN